MIYLLSPTLADGTKSLPMLTFEPLVQEISFDFINILLFTSKQAVITTDSITQEWKKYPSIAVGKATKQKILELGGEVIHMPKNFYGEEVAKDLLSYFYDKRILYLRPKKVAFDIKAYIEANGSKNGHQEVLVFEESIYETRCIGYTEEQKPQKNAIIIFTSPSTIKCFFKNFEWDKSYTAVIIGETTKAHLPKDCTYAVADEPLVNACIKKAYEIEKNRKK